MTAYKYVARDAESRVNWGDISKTWSDAILKVEEDRETKRQTIKTETDELANKLIEAPRGQHQGANEWTAGYADMQREALLDRYRQLTSGNLAVRDWNSALANAKQSTEQMFNLSKVYQEEYASIMERDQNMESQEAELALAAEFEGFTNFTDTVPLVDPVTLSAKIGRQVYDPETGTYRVGETITMNGMYNLLKGRYNRFDIQAAAAEDIKSLGKYTTVVMDGEVKTRENWQDDPLYKKELEAKIDVHFSNPQNITSVLTNAMDSGYSTTGLLDNVLDREGNVDEKKVFWVTNPAQASAGAKTPLISLDIKFDKKGNIVGRSKEELDDIFGENVTDAQRSALVRAANKQREEATDFMKTYYTAEVDLIETPQAEFPDSPGATRTTAGERGLLRQGVAGLRSLEKLHGGNEEEATEGLQNLLDRNYSKFSEGTVTIDEDTGERTANLVRYNPDTKQKEEVAIPIPASVMNTIDAFGPQFFDESTRPYLYEAYDTTKRLFGGVPGTATPSVSRPRAVSADNLDAEVVEFAGKEMDFATALSALDNEASAYVAVTKGLDLANANASTLSSIAGQLSLNAEIGVLPENDMEEKLGFDPRHTAVTMKFPDVNGFEVVILNDTEGVNAQRQLFREMAKRKINGESMTVEEIMSYLPADSKKLNEAANHSKIASGTSAIKLTLQQWKAANAAAIAGKDAAEINRMYMAYYKQ
jgi:hypothetical protein